MITLSANSAISSTTYPHCQERQNVSLHIILKTGVTSLKHQPIDGQYDPKVCTFTIKTTHSEVCGKLFGSVR